MPRLREVPRAEASESVIPLYDLLFGDRDPVAEPGTVTGTPGDWWTVTALVPKVFDHCVQGIALYQGSVKKLDPVLRELGQTRVGWTRQSNFVYSQHCKSCRTAGMSEEKIAAIPAWQTADCFSPIERAVLAYTDCLVLEGGRVPDGIFDALREGLSDEQILLFTYIVTMYDQYAVMSRALRLELDDHDDHTFETPAPGDDQTFRVN